MIIAKTTIQTRIITEYLLASSISASNPSSKQISSPRSSFTSGIESGTDPGTLLLLTPPCDWKSKVSLSKSTLSNKPPISWSANSVLSGLTPAKSSIEDAREVLAVATNSASFATLGAVVGCCSSADNREPLAGCMVSVDESGDGGLLDASDILRFRDLIELIVVLVFSIQPDWTTVVLFHQIRSQTQFLLIAIYYLYFAPTFTLSSVLFCVIAGGKSDMKYMRERAGKKQMWNVNKSAGWWCCRSSRFRVGFGYVCEFFRALLNCVKFKWGGLGINAQYKGVSGVIPIITTGNIHVFLNYKYRNNIITSAQKERYNRSSVFLLTWIFFL